MTDILVVILFAVMGLAVIFGLPLYLSYKVWNKKKYARYPVIAFWAWYSFIWFRAFYPDDQFFVAHLEEIFQMKFDDSVAVIFKSAGYPDIHGDYPACAIFVISEKDLQKITAMRPIDGPRDSFPGLSGNCDDEMTSRFDVKEIVSFSKDAPGETWHWGYIEKQRAVFFDYYSY